MERALLILLSLHLLGHGQASQGQEDEVVFISGGHPSQAVLHRILTGRFVSDNVGTSTEVLYISSSSSPCSRTTGDLPETRYSHFMDKMGDSILICGGGYDRSTEASCVSSRNASGPWLHHSTTNSRRWDQSSVIADGRLHLLGGQYIESTKLSFDDGGWKLADIYRGTEATMESFNEGGWTEQKLPFTISSGSCSVQTSHDTFIVTGGRRFPGGEDSINRKTWEWKAGAWRELEEMKIGRYHHACGTIVIGDKVFVVVAGGFDSNAPQSSEVFAEGRWQEMGDLVEGRGVGAKIVTVKVGGIQKMIIMGGEDINRNELNSVEELVVNDNVGQSTWQLSETKMKKGRSFFGAVSVPKSKFCNN